MFLILQAVIIVGIIIRHVHPSFSARGAIITLALKSSDFILLLRVTSLNDLGGAERPLAIPQ